MTEPYTIRPGDSPWSIARHHGVTVGELLVADPQLAAPGRGLARISTGETLALPQTTRFSKQTDLKDGTVTCDTEKIRRKNIIFVGSEMSYDSFWLKMMFVAPAVTVASGPRLLRRADETVIAYIDEGYTFLEKLPLEAVANQFRHRLVRLTDSAAIASVINDLPVTHEDGCTVRTKLQDVVFFCHGLPGVLALNYRGRRPDLDVTSRTLSAFDRLAFVDDGKLFSFACRTGTGSRSRSFQSDAEARPESSLAQQLADHFNITVMACLTRTFYGEVLRNRADSATTREGASRDRPVRGARGAAPSRPRRSLVRFPWLRRPRRGH